MLYTGYKSEVANRGGREIEKRRTGHKEEYM